MLKLAPGDSTNQFIIEVGEEGQQTTWRKGSMPFDSLLYIFCGEIWYLTFVAIRRQYASGWCDGDVVGGIRGEESLEGRRISIVQW